MLRELQQNFRAAVLGHSDTPVASYLSDAPNRIAIYRNTVQASLTDVLAVAFPVVRRIMGENNFTRAARRFIAAHPPRQPHLSTYGGDFPQFLETLEALQPLPYLSDVARLEWLRGESYFAADAPMLDPARLATVTLDSLPHLIFKLHPATHIITSHFPIHRIWTVNQPEHADVPEVDMSVAEAVLITRPDFAVTARKLSAGDTAFVQAVMTGAALSAAAENAVSVEKGFDLQAALQDHFTSGVFCDFAEG